MNGSTTALHNVSLLPGPQEFNLSRTNIFWVVTFSLTAVISIVGNILVILVFQVRFIRRKKCQTSLKPYLINLAVADLIMALFCMPFTFIDAIAFWVFPNIMCPLVVFLQVLSVAGSVFTNVVIGLNRLRAIIFPLKPLFRSRVYYWNILIIWLSSFAISCAQLIVSRTVEMNGTTHCRELWPSPQTARAYTMFVFTGVYAFPLLLLIVTYTAIGVSLWRNPRSDEIIMSKKKVVKMLVIVVAMFGVCWLPLHLFTLLLDFFPSLAMTVSHQTLTTLFMSCHWLAMSNSFANPIIYGFTNESFRADLVTLFYMWFPCCVCLTKMLPRHSSGSTYETVIFRRQSLYKQGAKINGTYHTRTVHAPRGSKQFLNGNSRNKSDYQDINCDQNKNGTAKTKTNGETGKRVIMSIDRDYVRLEPVAVSVSANSEPSVEET